MSIHEREPDARTIARRKTVTVLFSDIVESTSMAEQADPEALAERLTAYFDEMRTIVESHGGTVEKFIGDAVVGMFGVPTTHEDDAIRAVRAALAMQSTTGRLALQARIGLNTGEVALSGDASDGRLALGHSISMAARLEQAAAPGTILIGAPTFRLVAGAVEAEQLGPLVAKGSSEPIDAWRVTGLLEESPRGWAGQGLFVGRARELESIRAAFAHAAAERACVVVTVVAPPGMGKSRLAAEAARQLSERALVLVGRCVPYGEGTTYKPLTEIASSVELPDTDETVNRARQALTDSALASPEEAAWVFKQLLEAQAEERPVVAVLDDLHWAEPLLLDLLDYVVTVSVDRPIMLLCLARPDLLDTRPEWATPRLNSVTLRLEPLTGPETEALLDAGGTAVEDEVVRRRILDAAGGVPLFVEQLAAYRSDGPDAVPPTVRALLAARIDRLREEERIVLERAAIQGEVFDRATVATLAGDALKTPMASILVGLVRREFIRPERSIQGGERFRFSHALLRDAVYEQMPRRVRADLHKRYARVLLELGGDAEVVGHQLERAHGEAMVVAPTEPATAQLALEAGGALREAGLRAMARKEWQHGRDLLVRAQKLLASEPAQEIALLPDLLRAAAEMGDLVAATELHAQAAEGARSAGDTTTELRAEIEWAQLEMRRGNAEVRHTAAQLADRAVEYFSSLGDESNLATALLLQLTTPGVSVTQMIGILRRAQVHAENAGDERMRIEIWDELGGAMIYGPTPYPEILDFMEREVAWARERGIAFAEADGRLGLALAAHAAGDAVRARAGYAAVRELFEQLPGFVSQLGECDVLAAQVEVEEGDLVAADSLYGRAMDVLERGGHVPWWTTAALGRAHVLLELDRPHEARAVLDEVTRRGPLWSSRAQTLYLQALAKLAAARGNLGESLELAREAVAAVSDSDTPQYAAGAHEVLGDLLSRASDGRGSIAELNRARDLYAAKGYLPGQRRIEARLAPE